MSKFDDWTISYLNKNGIDSSRDTRLQLRYGGDDDFAQTASLNGHLTMEWLARSEMPVAHANELEANAMLALAALAEKYPRRFVSVNGGVVTLIEGCPAEMWAALDAIRFVTASKLQPLLAEIIAAHTKYARGEAL